MSAHPIHPTIALDASGKAHGFLRLPYSRNDSAWGSVMIPLTVIANGEGPTALLTGGNHGDEYEGPIALQQLAWEIDPADVSGRVIIVPYLNYPAFRAGARVSPIDQVNMNRCFPGRADGSPTQKIASYFNDVLVPMADLVLDYHSGGKTLDFLPYAAAHYLEDQDQQAGCVAAVRAFAAPYSMMMLEIDAVGMFDTAVESQGKVFVTTELGGGGTATARSAAIAIRGARNVLRHAGILAGEIEREGDSIMLDMPAEDCFHFATRDGLIHPLADLGDRVRAGQPIARIWPPDRTGTAPVEVLANRDGVIAARHFPGLVQSGDCLAVIADIAAG
ncbi:N(2)-acetyl-L-2,4-diaminobutanoate deacetylase DoeB [Paracoccus siganidrum]|uniref:N-alpha-acetyl diaminobutyric acid deacetylase DoeB n=1 Tax=Paracoccus siganidrum TaxID=1276757 RepID=A0A419AAD4_9RHOB|nr:N(2)-acetyl-L-2,4-diaminobutanoate deacetylase DoeB [Paracoccus siganidrum]RJL19681.1 N-alpha-acetyl diaminobutyric acid deacetylase DoeB [Paracoccus siganidrum]RMC35936.1 N-alpha-acetyl diaminobutyric acid deacetylase DoeB [Paracoccus siganidrum]